MLKALTTVTCILLILIYFLLLLLKFPYICLLKYRPSDTIKYNNFFVDPQIRVIPEQLDVVCSNPSQLDIIPMPSMVTLPNRTKSIHIPKKIRIVTQHSWIYSIFQSHNQSTFTLFIDHEIKMETNSYPYLSIDESYQLNITSRNRAYLLAKTYVGIIRGLSTFTQLQYQKRVTTPIFIFDKPQFPWRGLMLDVVRHFIPIRIIKETIDSMQLVKMNVLHLHLSDDQGFRFESKRFPKLHDTNEYYSQNDLKDLIEYARIRAIRIIPEFDIPGHTASWFVGYPNLSSNQDSFHRHRIEDIWGIHNATMDVTRQSTYDFLDEFFSEVTQLFPDEYFHVGGDECASYEWMQSEDISKFMRENNIYGYSSLQAYFTGRVDKILNKYNRTMVGWDEIIVSTISNKSVIQSWRSQAALIDAATRGYQSILSHGFYLDHMGAAEYHYFNNIRADMVDDIKIQERILGGEACLWTEYIDANMVHSRVWPRTAAIAERLWSSAYDRRECMYERLSLIDKRFFHPNDDEYMEGLSKLMSNATVLRFLADVCEPLGLHGRDQTRNYTRHTPLNRFIDILRPESEHVRQLMKTNNLSLLHSTFVSWKTNEIHLYSNNTEILQLAKNLARLGDIGISLIKLLNNNEGKRLIVSSRWFYYQDYVLYTLEYQVPEIRLAAIRILKRLLERSDPCSFDIVNLVLIIIFPVIVIFAQRITCIRRRLLIPCLNSCFYYCNRR